MPGQRLPPESDVEFTRMLVEGLLTNEDRYGYWPAPALASGERAQDRTSSARATIVIPTWMSSKLVTARFMFQRPSRAAKRRRRYS